MSNNQQEFHLKISRELGSISSTLNGIEKHLERLNGQVEKNTAHRNQSKSKSASWGAGAGVAIVGLIEVIKQLIHR